MVLSASDGSVDKTGRMIPTTSSLLETNVTQPYSPVEEELFCKLILYIEISNTRFRVWDIIILVPNLLFLIFLIFRFNRARLKLRATSSPIFFAFYGLVLVNVVISVIRCVVSMSVNAAAVVGGYVDTFLWITVRFFLLSTEMSVVIFGLAFGHLDSRSSIRYVLLATSLLSLAFSISQGALEVLAPDESFRIHSKDFNLFGHGGMLFWFSSSVIFSLIYLVILVLPWTRLRERLNLPTKKSFYLYILFLALLNIAQSVGSGLLMYGLPEGLCIVDVTTCIYFTLFTPLVYQTFLSEFFGVSQPSIMFSYKAQVDDTMEEDTVSLPHQQSFSSLKTDSDYIYQDKGQGKDFQEQESKSVEGSSPAIGGLFTGESNSVYDSTHFDSTMPAPLYNAALQSPDSITGYSLDSQTIDLPSHPKQ